MLTAETFLTLALLCSGGQDPTPRSPGDAPPPSVAAFLRDMGKKPDRQDVFVGIKDHLWSVYPENRKGRDPLVKYVLEGPDGPGVAFAAAALIAFHDPRTVEPMVRRALDPATSQFTRYFLLNSAPYVLAMGDQIYAQGELDERTRDFARFQVGLARSMARGGIGNVHARNLREVHDANQRGEIEDTERIELLLWHQSAYLIGSLDLCDEPVLGVFLDPSLGVVYVNVLQALCLAANRDFAAPLRDKVETEVDRDLEKRLVEKAQLWWKDYALKHPDGDWLAAVVSAFQEADYKLEKDLRSRESRKELLRALLSEDIIHSYNAARLLNRIHETHFDLERIFHAAKYAQSFLDPGKDRPEDMRRLRGYWRERLTRDR